MINTRIRYVENPDGTLESGQVLTGGKAEYKVIISADCKEGYILSLPQMTIKMKVTGVSAHKTKIAVKRALKSLGVIFLNEKRTS